MNEPNVQEIIREHFRAIASRGGKARAAALSPERRSAIAKKASKAATKARKAKRRKEQEES